MSLVSALQAALAGEHATIYGYGVAGAVFADHQDVADLNYATAALHTHELLRDQLATLITTAGETPVAAKPAYELGVPVVSMTTARQLAAHLEQGVAGGVWDVIAATSANARLRTTAVTWLSDTALRAAHWGNRQALPGQPA